MLLFHNTVSVHAQGVASESGLCSSPSAKGNSYLLCNTSHVLSGKSLHTYADDTVAVLEIPKLADIISIGDKLDSDRPIGERQSPDGQEEESDSNTTVKAIGL